MKLRRFGALLGALLIVLSMAAPCFARGVENPNITRVLDWAEMFTDKEEELLNREIRDKIINRHGYDFVIITANGYEGNEYSYAEEIYDYYEYGAEGTGEGSYLFICMDPSDRFWIAEGCEGTPYQLLGDYDNINVLDDAIEPYMKDGRYCDAMQVYVSYLDTLYTDGAFYSYQTQTPPAAAEPPQQKGSNLGGILGIAGAAGMAGGLISQGSAKSRMRTISKATSAESYEVPGRFNFIRQDDILLDTVVTVVRREDPEERGGRMSHSGGSTMGGHHTSSGGHHFSGGGGRHF